MSDKLGKIDYSTEQDTYLGKMNSGRSISPETQEIIDAEVRRLVDEGYQKAKSILTEKRRDLERLAEGLLEFETLTGDEITRVIEGKKPAPITKKVKDTKVLPIRQPSSNIVGVPKVKKS